MRILGQFSSIPEGYCDPISKVKRKKKDKKINKQEAEWVTPQRLLTGRLTSMHHQ
jgi:hypothetical protein